MSALEDPSLFVVTAEQFVGAGLEVVDASFVKEVFGENRELTRQELWSRLEEFSDFFISYDWGRDFGIDNHKRVKELTDFLSQKLGYTFCQNAEHMKKCRLGAVFLTDRYLRRYSEQAYIKKEFYQIQETFEPTRQLVFQMEARAARNSSVLAKDYPDITNVKTISVKDYDNVFEVIGYRVLGEMQHLPSLRTMKERMNFESKKSIFDAVQNGNNTVLQEALEKGYCSPNDDKNLEGMMLLHIAVQHNHPTCVQMLLNAGANVNLPGGEGAMTPLHIACESNFTDIILMLLERPEINVNCGNIDKCTPAHFAAMRDRIDILRVLAKRKADLTIPNKSGEPPMDFLFSHAAKEGLQGILDAQLEFIGAAQQNDLQLLKDLVGSRPDWVSSFLDDSNADGRSTLYFACMNKNIEMVRYLLAMGADINHLDNWNDNALSHVCFYCDDATEFDLVKLLVDAGADVHNINVWGNSPFLNVCQCNAPQVALYLLEHCHPNINLKGVYFRTNQTLSIAEVVILEKNVILLRALLNAGVIIESNDILKEIISLGIVVELDISAFSANSSRFWFQLLQFEDPTSPNTVDSVCRIISEVVQKYPKLLSVKDHNGRIANVVATDVNKKILNSLFLWYGRYRPTQTKPDHCSATTYVFKAMDESSLDETGNHRPVAIKLMRFKQHFEKELFARKVYKLEDDCIVQVIASYPSEEDLPSWPDDIGEDSFLGQESSLTKAQVEKMYCVVMHLADRNMFVSLKQERFAGRNFEVIREIFRQLVVCTDHLHQRGILHADIKPLNIMRVESAWKLIDLDAACQIGKENVCVKYSTGYCPPEAIFIDKVNQFAMARDPVAIKSFPDKCHGLLAHPSFDVWSLGCVLFQLCSREALPLFVVGQNDNLTTDSIQDDNLFQLEEWSDAFKKKKLQQIEDPMAKNLLSLILSRDPSKRPSLSRILSHPFLTGKDVVRLPGTSAEFDLFLSYRVASDLYIAQALHDRLTAKGYKVWWDKKCLPVGLDWKQGFCAGLLQSRSYLCVMSKDAINHSTIDRQNWTRLEEGSDCDNLLLELRLAFEFNRLGFLDRLVPLFRGEFDEKLQCFQEYNWKEHWPQGAPDCIIKRVEESVQEEMEGQGLGTSVLSDEKDLISVQGLLREVGKKQGIFLVGQTETAYETAVESIGQMLDAIRDKQDLASSASMTHVNVIRRLGSSDT